MANVIYVLCYTDEEKNMELIAAYHSINAAKQAALEIINREAIDEEDEIKELPWGEVDRIGTYVQRRGFVYRVGDAQFSIHILLEDAALSDIFG